MRHRVATPLRLSLLLSVPVWCATLSGVAHAACTNNPPASGQTVDCTGAATTPVIAPAGVTGVTVNIESGASVAGTNTIGNQHNTVFVNDDSTVNNNGAINTTAGTTSRDYVGVNLNGSNATLNNNSTTSGAATPDGGINVTNTGNNTNRLYGVISTAPDGSEYANVQVTNNGSINVTQTTASATPGLARGVYSGENIDSMTVDNFGSITVASTKNVTNAVAAVDSDDDTDTLTVNNHAGATMTAVGPNSFTVGGRAQDYTLVNDGTITNTNGKAAINIYGPGMATVMNSETGVITGDVYLTDLSPIVPNAGQAGNDYSRDSVFTNLGTVTGAFHYGNGVHSLDNSGTITGGITVNQTVPTSPASSTVAAGLIAPGGAAFTLVNTGTLGGDIAITDRAESVNDITLRGTGFSGNVTTTGAGSNTLTLNGVTSLQSVQNFSTLNLRRSNVAVANGVSLVDGATIRTNVYGPGGTRGAPSTQLGTINGALTLQGAATLVPTFATLVRNGDVYQVASSVTGGPVTVQPGHSALVSAKADTSDGRLLLQTQVRSAFGIGGLNEPSAATLNALLTYRGNNAQVRALGGLVESFASLGQVRAAATALQPITNGADIQTPINAAMLFHQQIDSRLDSFVYAQIPVSGRSADLGVPRPVYAVVPANGAWAEAIGGGTHQDGVNQVMGYNSELEGVIGGYDRLIVPGFRIGGAFGYIDARINGNTNLGTREGIQTYQGLAYAAYEGPHVYLRGSVGGGGVDYSTARRVAFGTFTDNAFGVHSGDIITARGEGGLPYEFRNSLLVPYAAFTYSHLHQSAYAESSGLGTGFRYGAASNDSERSEVGGKVIVPLIGLPVFSYLFPVGSFVSLEGRAAYVHEFGNVAQTVSASFTGGGDVFIASGPVPNRDMVDYGVGLRMGSGNVQVDISYNGLARSTYLQQVGLLRARYLF